LIRIDELMVPAPPGICFRVAADVEQWPDLLSHYRWVRFHSKESFGHGVVEMAAWRDFLGPLRYPTWWVSEMEVDEAVPVVRYRHVDGITKGMDVRWEFTGRDGSTEVRIVHEWSGPPWPLVGPWAADSIIGPGFVSVIAQRTLRGVGHEAIRLFREEER
jgi:hypothetical protein